MEQWGAGILFAAFIAFLGFGINTWLNTVNRTAAWVLFVLSALFLLGSIYLGYQLWKHRKDGETAIAIPLPTCDKSDLLLETPPARIPGFPLIRVYGKRLPLQIEPLPTSTTIRANTALTFKFLFEGIEPLQFSVPSLKSDGQVLVPLNTDSDSQSATITWEIPYSSPPRDYLMEGVTTLANSDRIEWKQIFKI